MTIFPYGTYSVVADADGGPDLIRLTGSQVVFKAFPFKRVGYDAVNGDLYLVFDAYATKDGKIKTALKYYIK